MPRQLVTNRVIIIMILLLQVIPLLLFPSDVFTPTTQEWWLPGLLVVMVLIADVQLVFGRNNALWPWHLFAFSQGFNIISRLMMVWSHATITERGGATVINSTYVSLTILSIVISALLLWYLELPQVRMTMATR
jgi:hypothetical protein